MKNNLLLLLLLVYTANVFAQTPPIDPHYELLWSDDFEGNTLNRNIWWVKDHFDHIDPSTERMNIYEQQIYLDNDKNHKVENGLLKIKAFKENYSCSEEKLNIYGCVRQMTTGESYNYTSAWLETKKPYYAGFGYLEAKIKVDDNPGLFPAFWTSVRGSSGGYDSYEEIDIFEMLPGSKFCSSDEIKHNAYVGSSNINYGKYQEGNVIEEIGGFCGPLYEEFSISDYRKWHVYGVEWSPTKIVWYLDGIIVRSIKNDYIFEHAPVILNVAIKNLQPVYGVFPAEMSVDYVRFYKYKQDCSEVVAGSFNVTTYNNIAKKEIRIDDSEFYSGELINIKAESLIELSKNVSINSGVSFYADANGYCPEELSLTTGSCTQTINLCNTNISLYQDNVKKEIVLGGCSYKVEIEDNLTFRALDKIRLVPNLHITPKNAANVNLKIDLCR